jgi:hypothetical protein
MIQNPPLTVLFLKTARKKIILLSLKISWPLFGCDTLVLPSVTSKTFLAYQDPQCFPRMFLPFALTLRSVSASELIPDLRLK